MATGEGLGLGQRVHWAGNPHRIGTVKFVGAVAGYDGEFVGVDWDAGDGKHDGALDGVRYFQTKSAKSGSFVRPHNLSRGIAFLEALHLRYRSQSNPEDADDMYVLSASNRRVPVELIGEEKIMDKFRQLEELKVVSLVYQGVSSFDDPSHLSSIIPNTEELDLTGNLLYDWKDVWTFCKQLPALVALNLSCNLMGEDIAHMPQLNKLRILVLNYTGICWAQVDILKQSLPSLEELHLMGNNISEIEPVPSCHTEGFSSLRLLNLDNNSISDWEQIMKFSQLESLEQIYLNNNNLKLICYPCVDNTNEYSIPFPSLRCLLLGNNCIQDLDSIGALNPFPKLVEVRLSENPITDVTRGGLPRFSLVAQLPKIQTLNGSEVSARERKESELRYVRLIMSKEANNGGVERSHPRFNELKVLHGIEDEKPSVAVSYQKGMASGLLSVTLKCVGASIGEKPPQSKKLPGSTTVGKLKFLCESFFGLKSRKPKLFLEEEGSPFPIPLDDDRASLVDMGIGNGSIILVDEEHR
ncbi:hypothetical protein MLD38_016744 [Melastoma candidum]|uniref:Uncharacterized protein n=1 Tax=Melastoma candidum TaxID=119954 RepID=A0ACB9QQ83_9MYRT|nr:hypothetical protein MLD38_016744 [Melastoma candidum]